MVFFPSNVWIQILDYCDYTMDERAHRRLWRWVMHEMQRLLSTSSTIEHNDYHYTWFSDHTGFYRWRNSWYEAFGFYGDETGDYVEDWMRMVQRDAGTVILLIEQGLIRNSNSSIRESIRELRYHDKEVFLWSNIECYRRFPFYGATKCVEFDGDDPEENSKEEALERCRRRMVDSYQVPIMERLGFIESGQWPELTHHEDDWSDYHHHQAFLKHIEDY